MIIFSPTTRQKQNFEVAILVEEFNLNVIEEHGYEHGDFLI